MNSDRHFPRRLEKVTSQKTFFILFSWLVGQVMWDPLGQQKHLGSEKWRWYFYLAYQYVWTNRCEIRLNKLILQLYALRLLVDCRFQSWTKSVISVRSSEYGLLHIDSHIFSFRTPSANLFGLYIPSPAPTYSAYYIYPPLISLGESKSSLPTPK